MVVISGSDGTVSQPADGGRVFIRSTTARISAAVSTRLFTSLWPKPSGSTNRRQIHPARVGVGVGGGVGSAWVGVGGGLWARFQARAVVGVESGSGFRAVGAGVEVWAGLGSGELRSSVQGEGEV